MSRRNLAHREVSNIGKFEGVFFGAAKLLYDNADRVDENRRSHPLLVAVENGDQTEVVNQLSGISGTAKMEELFEYVTDFVSICCCLDTMLGTCASFHSCIFSSCEVIRIPWLKLNTSFSLVSSLSTMFSRETMLCILLPLLEMWIL